MTEVKPKSKKGKKILYIIATIAALIGINHFTAKVGYTEVEVSLTDSSVIVEPVVMPVDSVKPIVADSAKKDTTKK